MRYLSKVASLACIAGVSITLVGCGSSSKPAAGTGDCPIPPSVKAQNVVLDQNMTKKFLGLSGISALEGVWFIDDVFWNTLFSLNTDKISMKKIELEKGAKKQILVKTANIIKNIKSLKEDPLSDDELQVGDNIPCEEGGTYSLHYKFQESDGMEDGVSKGNLHFDVDAKFNNCKTVDGPELGLAKFIYYYNGFVNRMSGSEAEEDVWVFNGTSKSNVDLVFSVKKDGEEKTGTTSIESFDLNVSIKNSDLNFSREDEDGKIEFLSDGSLGVYVKMDGERYYKDFESNDENETIDDINFTYDAGMNLNVRESDMYMDKDDNTTDGYEFEALCYSNRYNGDWRTEIYEYETNDENDSNVSKGDGHFITNSLSSGYLSVSFTDDGEEKFLDEYTSNHKTTSDTVLHRLKDDENDINDYDNLFSVNGVVGTSLYGGSVNINTVSGWMSSSDYAKNREDYIMAIVFDPYFWIGMSPYAGQTKMSSANSATIGFDVDDDNETYGYIQIGDDYQEYDSINDMFDFGN